MHSQIPPRDSSNRFFFFIFLFFIFKPKNTIFQTKSKIYREKCGNLLQILPMLMQKIESLKQPTHILSFLVYVIIFDIMGISIFLEAYTYISYFIHVYISAYPQ